MIGMTRRKFEPKSIEFDKAAFDAWLETGSLMYAGFKLKKEGKLKPNGKPYSTGGVRFAALRHYVRNYPETRQEVEKTYIDHGFIAATENLDIATINYVFQQFGRTNDTIEWLKMHGLYEMYEEYINEKIAKRELYRNKRKFVDEE